MADITVVLAEDQPIVRRGLKLLIDSESDMSVVDDVGDCLSCLRSVEKLRPDVVVLDIEMPSSPGLAVIGQIVEAAPSTSVLMLTGHENDEYLDQAISAGAKGYMLKVSNAQALPEAIRVVHRGEVYFHPRMAARFVSQHLRQQADLLAPDGYETLSLREREVLPLVAECMSNREIAATMNLSPNSVQTYKTRMMKKLGLDTRAGLIRFALKRNLISKE